MSELVVGYFLAQLFMRDFPFKGFFRTIHTLPLMVAPIAVGATWRLLTVPGLGPLPYYLEQVVRHRLPHRQLSRTRPSSPPWSWMSGTGRRWSRSPCWPRLSSLPKEPFEQAQIDGANRFQIFWHITLPMLKPAILATVFIRLMDALRIVDEVWMLTGGGPGAATRYIGLYIWRVVFPKTDYGYGSAMSLLTLYLTIVMCWLLYVALVARREPQEAELMHTPPSRPARSAFWIGCRASSRCSRSTGCSWSRPRAASNCSARRASCMTLLLPRQLPRAR